MDAARLRSERLRSHRLSAPASTVVAAAEHMLATQGQEFWGGRWALAARAKGAPTLSDVDAAFDRGALVRSWTMRGTIHVIPARDLAWVLSLTGERQFRGVAAVRRAEGIDEAELARAEAAVRSALRGGGQLTRTELFGVLDRAGVSTAGQRGYHLLASLSLRVVVCQGPVVAREGAPTREQRIVLAEEWIRDSASPADPLAELAVRFIASHGPAGARDLAWWSGLPLGEARRGLEAASDRLVRVSEHPEPWFVVAAARPRRSPAAPEVVALPPFEEYFLSYADRTAGCAPEHVLHVATGGAMRPIVLARGEIVATWLHSLAVGRHRAGPVAETLVPGGASDEEISAALERYRRFITG